MSVAANQKRCEPSERLVALIEPPVAVPPTQSPHTPSSRRQLKKAGFASVTDAVIETALALSQAPSAGPLVTATTGLVLSILKLRLAAADPSVFETLTPYV